MIFTKPECTSVIIVFFLFFADLLLCNWNMMLDNNDLKLHLILFSYFQKLDLNSDILFCNTFPATMTYKGAQIRE